MSGVRSLPKSKDGSHVATGRQYLISRHGGKQPCCALIASEGPTRQPVQQGGPSAVDVAVAAPAESQRPSTTTRQ